ncbi:Tudor domain-containing protein 1 [Varanus komodoensis]|nr:Tudor domain-containing protein 1 [Varanus komodoensis]
MSAPLVSKGSTDNVEDNAKTFDETKKKENMLSTNTNKIKEQDEKREEQANRVMFSDLNTLGVKKSMKIEGTITEFHNPDEFFVLVNSSEVLSNITKLIVKLKDYSGVNQDEYVPVRGEVGVAKYSVDQVPTALFVLLVLDPWLVPYHVLFALMHTSDDCDLDLPLSPAFGLCLA